MKFIDITGNRYGKLLVIKREGHRGKRILWRCRCDCGNLKLMMGNDLRSGAVKSCGCYRNTVVADRNRKRSGINSDNWKGGKSKRNGYWYIYSPDHPNKNACGKGYVKRCRLVMEKYLNRFLDAKEEIHHINGKKDDDRVENLEILSKVTHKSIHSKELMKIIKRDYKGRFSRKEVMPNASL